MNELNPLHCVQLSSVIVQYYSVVHDCIIFLVIALSHCEGILVLMCRTLLQVGGMV